jgi:hypothetical protein
VRAGEVSIVDPRPEGEGVVAAPGYLLEERHLHRIGIGRGDDEFRAAKDLSHAGQRRAPCECRPPEEFADTVREAHQTKNYALLDVARQVYTRRVLRDGEKDLAEAGSALVEAQKVELLRDVQRVNARLVELAVLQSDLAGVLNEITLPPAHPRPRAAADRTAGGSSLALRLGLGSAACDRQR